MDPRSGRASLSGARLTRPTDTADAKDRIRDRARKEGFDTVGFAPATLSDQNGKWFEDFLEAGAAGDMGWLAARAAERRSPDALWPGARSVISVGLNYGPGKDPLEILNHPERGAISVYAQGRDYHDVLKKKLRVLARWVSETWDCEVKLFVDTAPVMEKPLAAQAGLGWQGKHTNLVSREFGSWLFLGEIFTALEIEPDKAETDHCGICTNCLDICPTNAFAGPYRLDARKCISYLTIEHKGHIPEEFRKPIGNRIYGCDDCLAVCPWNKYASAAKEADLTPHISNIWPRLADLVQIDDQAFRDIFSRSPVKRLGRDRFVRNVLIAIGNSGDRELIPAIEARLDDSSPLVRAMAVWALRQLAPSVAFQASRARYGAGESDQAVVFEWNSDN